MLCTAARAGSHAPDEYIDRNQLQAACAATALSASTWCGISTWSRPRRPLLYG